MARNARSQIIYQDDTGYFSGHQQSDGFWWIKEFVIYPNFRGKGLAKKLASHLPKKCKLLAYPLINLEGPMLSKSNLIRFYSSLGFTPIQDEYGNTIMQRI